MTPGSLRAGAARRTRLRTSARDRDRGVRSSPVTTERVLLDAPGERGEMAALASQRSALSWLMVTARPVAGMRAQSRCSNELPRACDVQACALPPAAYAASVQCAGTARGVWAGVTAEALNA